MSSVLTEWQVCTCWINRVLEINSLKHFNIFNIFPRSTYNVRGFFHLGKSFSSFSFSGKLRLNVCLRVTDQFHYLASNRLDNNNPEFVWLASRVSPVFLAKYFCEIFWKTKEILFVRRWFFNQISVFLSSWNVPLKLI